MRGCLLGKCIERKRRNKCRSVQGDLKSSQHGTSASCDDGSPSDSFREPHLESPQPLLEAPEPSLQPTKQLWQAPEPLLEPKHKIFLSHSGADKDFTWQLCEDLERVHHFPFFDKRDDSLPKGEKFPPLIMEAAKQCRVAILVLSDEFFTRSKWPMIELNAFVEAQKSNNTGLKILPLFLGLTMDQFSEKERRQNWLQKWQDMSLDDGRIIVKDWQHALLRIPGGINAMEYNGAGEGHVAFRKKVVAAVCKLVRPDVQWDVSHVQSMDMLSKPILQKIKEIEPSEKDKVRVVGLYGMGGIGKTTMSRVVCNEMFGDFCGKACHVEFGSMNSVEMRKKVLQELTEASPEILNDSLGQLADLLKKRMRRQEVFLALDNILDDQIEEALMYLEVGYHAGSIVLVTSRSLDILKSLGISECDCLEMPELEEKGATDLFLHYSGRSKESPINEDEREIIERCVEECHFLKILEIGGSGCKMERVYQYLPLALETLGRQLRSISGDVLRWEEILKKLEANKASVKFNLRKGKIHPIFSVLRLGYDTLCLEEQHLFLDLALLYLPRQRDIYYIRTSEDFDLSNLWKWFCITQRKGQDEMKEAVNGLRRKGLLDKVSEVNELHFNIHDLYLDFAEVEAQAGPFERRRFLIEKGGVDVPLELVKNPPSLCWSSLERLIIRKSKVQSLGKAKLHLCSNVEVLELFCCEELEEVDVSGMGSLRSVEIVGCPKLGGRLVGIKSLSNLVILRCFGSRDFMGLPHVALELEFLRNLSSLTTLQTLQLEHFVWSEVDMFPPNLSACTNLQELSLRCSWIFGPGFHAVSELPDSVNMPKSLMKIDFSDCFTLVRSSLISSLSFFTNLQYLSLRGCYTLTDGAGLSELIYLEYLNVSGTPVSELPDLRKYKKLQVLDVLGCLKLESIVGIAHATALLHVNAMLCASLKELPDDLSGLEKLETLDLRQSSAICTLPIDYKRLAGRGIIKVGGCWGLIVALVQELQQPERLQDECLNSIGCISRGEISMQLWIDAMKAVNRTAYDLLKHVVNAKVLPFGDPYDGKWSYLLNDGEKDDLLVRALCEHGDMGGKDINILSHFVAEVTKFYESNGCIEWWAVVATAPCTFEVVMERAMLEPWDKTLLHYTIVTILPRFLSAINLYSNSWGHGESNWLNRGIEVVLQKCKEKLKEASDLDIDRVHSAEGQEVADTLLRELEATKYSRDLWCNREWTCSYQVTLGLSRYCDIYPNFPFGKALALQEVHSEG